MPRCARCVTQRRPQAPRGPLAPELTSFQPTSLVELEQDRLLKNLRSARRGAAGGPSGMTADHVRPLLDSERDAESFCHMCEEFARAQVSDEVVQALRMGRMTALQKSLGGIRGIIVGDFIRRLVARTLAPIEQATSPFQFALTTKSGYECIAHIAQALTDLDANATLLSVDGIGAFDLISWGAMLQGLLEVEGALATTVYVKEVTLTSLKRVETSACIESGRQHLGHVAEGRDRECRKGRVHQVSKRNVRHVNDAQISANRGSESCRRRRSFEVLHFNPVADVAIRHARQAILRKLLFFCRQQGRHPHTAK